MILSMTGFGKAEHTEEGTTVTIEVSSVNGRFFDLKTKMPKSLNQYENDIRKMVQSYIDRGRVSLSIHVDRPGLKAEGVDMDTALAGRYLALAEELTANHSIEGSLDIKTLLSLPDVIVREENGFDAESVWSAVKKAVVPALEAHKEMREREGAAIGEDMKSRLKAIGTHITEIAGCAPASVQANTERLREKITNLIGSETFDETRFAMEVALYSDRVDITEELVRLKSHCEQYESELSTSKTSGRKLSFLLQEMNRETNTIASKASDAGISQLAVKIKEELEKMREQAENME